MGCWPALSERALKGTFVGWPLLVLLCFSVYHRRIFTVHSVSARREATTPTSVLGRYFGTRFTSGLWRQEATECGAAAQKIQLLLLQIISQGTDITTLHCAIGRATCSAILVPLASGPAKAQSVLCLVPVSVIVIRRPGATHHPQPSA